MRRICKVIFPVLAFLLFSCKKDSRVLGVDVQPATDNVNAIYVPGLPVTAHTITYDSIASFNDRYKYIGSNNDPFFGRVDIGLYLNPTMDYTNLNFQDSSILYSAEFVFAVDNAQFAGDKNAVLNFSVYPMTQRLDVSQAYYTKNKRYTGATPICTTAVTFTVDTATNQTTLHIKIDSSYASTLMHDTPNLTSNDVFQTKYKGYYIAASLQNGSEGIMYKADLDDALTGFNLHYKTGPHADSLTTFKFAFTGSTVLRYNTVNFMPNAALVDQFKDSTLGGTNLYLKGMGMTKLKLQIPFLRNYTDSFKVAVNRAELVLNLDPAYVSSGYYAPPDKLTLFSMDSLSRETFVKDVLNPTDYARYDGTYDATNNRYVFNLAREAQLILSGKKPNRGFYVAVANTDITLSTQYAGSTKELVTIRRDNYFERVVIAGTNNPQLKPVFNLNYVRFKND